MSTEITFKTYVHYFHYKNNKPTILNNKLSTESNIHSCAIGEQHLPTRTKIFPSLRNSYYERVFSLYAFTLFAVFLQQLITLPKMRKAWEDTNASKRYFFIFSNTRMGQKRTEFCMGWARKTSINGIMKSFTRFERPIGASDH